MNILLCYNTEHKETIQNFIKTFKKQTSEQLTFCEVTSFKMFEKQLPLIRNNHYDRVMVQCELSWKNHLHNDFWGINLVQEKLCLDPQINTPVVFLSLTLERSKIIEKDSTKAIIAAFALGYHFIQLPICTPDEEIKKCFSMPNSILPLEKEDGYHFAARDKMVASIRHDIREKNLNECKNQLKAIITSLQPQDKKEFKEKMENANSIGALRELCDELQLLLLSANQPLLSSTNSAADEETIYNILLLDDEKTNEITALIKEAKNYRVEIKHCTSTSDAYKIIKKDRKNQYTVLLIDFRIWDNPEANFPNRLMSERQGYRFIEDIAQWRPYSTFIALSNLPRMFRMAIAGLSEAIIIPEEKSIVFSTPEQRKHFISKIIYWAKQNRLKLTNRAFKYPIISETYSLLSQKELDAISHKALNFIKRFTEKYNPKIAKIFNEKDKTPLEQLGQYKTEWDFNTEEENIANWVKVQEKEKSNRRSNSPSSDLTNIVMNSLASGYGYTESIGGSIAEKFQCYLKKEIRERNFITDFYTKLSEEEKRVILSVKKNKKPPFNPQKPAHIEKFKEILAIRRFALFLFLWLKVHCEETITERLPFTISNMVNSFLSKGYINVSDQRERSNIIGKNLFFKSKAKLINTFEDIALTLEEEAFFKDEKLKWETLLKDRKQPLTEC